MYSFRDEEEYEAFHQYMLEQRQQYEEWMESEEGIQEINCKLIDAAYEDKNEIDLEV